MSDLPVEIVPADFFNPSDLLSHLKDVDYVVHIAGVSRAKRNSDFFRGNVETTANLLEAASHFPSIKKFCFISSLTAVGPSENGVPLDEHAACRPVTTYGQSKLEAEKACHRFSGRIPIVILRPPAVYGPRDRDILHMFRWVRLGLVPILGPIQKTLSLLYVTELARAIVLATRSDRSDGQTYFVGDPDEYQYLDLVSISASLLGRRTISFPIPEFLLYPIAGATQAVSMFLRKPSVVNIEKIRDLVSPHWVCNPGKIKKQLGFSTEIRAEEGLRRTLDWYRTQGWL